MPVSVTVTKTPNEHALKFSVNKNILDSGYKTFNNMEEAKDFPLAAKIFKNADVPSIFFMAETEGAFISVTKKPNSYGLFDMTENVWEWTNSHRESTQGKVLRGGSWRNSMNAMQSFKWITSLPIHRFHYVGFRYATSKLPARSN